jgi:hypothetical protein
MDDAVEIHGWLELMDTTKFWKKWMFFSTGEKSILLQKLRILAPLPYPNESDVQIVFFSPLLFIAHDLFQDHLNLYIISKQVLVSISLSLLVHSVVEHLHYQTSFIQSELTQNFIHMESGNLGMEYGDLLTCLIYFSFIHCMAILSIFQNLDSLHWSARHNGFSSESHAFVYPVLTSTLVPVRDPMRWILCT